MRENTCKQLRTEGRARTCARHSPAVRRNEKRLSSPNPDDSHPREWPKRICIYSRIRIECTCRQLIDIALALIVNAVPPYIPDLHCDIAGQFARDCCIPVPRDRDLERRVLNGHCERKHTLCRTRWRIDVAIDDSLLQLERSVAAKRRIAIDHDAIGK